MMACTLAGHRFRFRSRGRTMIWECERGCGAGGTKEYTCAQDAARYASAFDRDGSDALGRRAPLIGLLPLRIWRRFKDRR